MHAAAQARQQTPYPLHASKLHLNHFVLKAVLPGRGHISHIAPGPRRQHDLVLNQGVLLHCGIYVTTCQPVTGLQAVQTPLNIA